MSVLGSSIFKFGTDLGWLIDEVQCGMRMGGKFSSQCYCSNMSELSPLASAAYKLPEGTSASDSELIALKAGLNFMHNVAAGRKDLWELISASSGGPSSSVCQWRDR